MSAPGIPQVMQDLGVTNGGLASFAVSVLVGGFTVGPLLIAPFSELYGRSIIYRTCGCFFLVATVGCALSPNIATLIVCRFFAGCFGACPLVLGAATVADILPPERRGEAMSLFVLGPLMSPSIAPTVGG